ncbi:hypothetical protein LCM20_12915 [Halobacillus litoralis]|uniref:hypothetical protein n=1 Tax=Halobacillus litoralis TaxID=45668 RepID=UPI001CD5E72B|nr:hypothetical protein [Halobacillus litoralis]MCA0971500.1 hypothetical protein [Halobacillus litoralis]
MKKLTIALMMFMFIVGIAAGFLLHLTSIDTADEQVDQIADQSYALSLPEQESVEALSEQDIVRSYQSSYSSLVSDAGQRIQSLASEAQQEYVTKMNNQEDVSYSYFFSKYSSAANRLEKTTDEAFAVIHDQMSQQLESSGYPSHAAEELKKDYEQTKKQWRSTWLDEVQAAF